MPTSDDDPGTPGDQTQIELGLHARCDAGPDAQPPSLLTVLEDRHARSIALTLELQAEHRHSIALSGHVDDDARNSRADHGRLAFLEV